MNILLSADDEGKKSHEYYVHTAGYSAKTSIFVLKVPAHTSQNPLQQISDAINLEGITGIVNIMLSH